MKAGVTVLRRIVRRAIRHGYSWGARSLFFTVSSRTLARAMGGAYPELRRPKSASREALLSAESTWSDALFGPAQLRIGPAHRAREVRDETVKKRLLAPSL